ncbi:MAG: hypothetical protein M5U12_13875 [Verrucomicrobia bacterium]|nr:hypothetical protein [Verrucomicrobiota bacterium]
MTATIEPLLQSPRLPALVDELQHVICGFAVPVRAAFDPQVNLRTLARLTQD